MKCDCCPLSPYDDTCPECEGEYGIEYKDGSLGCRHPRNWVEKRDNEREEAYENMDTDMSIEMSLTEEELARAIEVCEHMIGLDYKSPYHRHGKAFYKPRRNFYVSRNDKESDDILVLDKLPFSFIDKQEGVTYVWYKLTEKGLAWLGRQLKITIWEVK